MANGKKVAVWLSVAVLVGVGGYFAWDWWKKRGAKKKEEQAKPEVPAGNATTPPGATDTNAKTGVKPSESSIGAGVSKPSDTFPLKVGSSGQNVMYLQKALKKLGANVPTNGSFTQDTYNAVLLKAGTKYYPVTQANFTEILKMANAKK